MFILLKDNIERHVDSEERRDLLLNQGFKLQEVDLSKLKVSELKERAKEIGIEGFGSMNKDELIDALEGSK